MATIQEIQVHIEELKRLVPGMPSLALSEPWFIPGSWAEHEYPNSSLPGVYIFADVTANIIYVGKASTGLGYRIGNEYVGRDGVLKGNKVVGAAALYTIPLPKQLFFLSPAVEEFLISRLQPERNSVGKIA